MSRTAMSSPPSSPRDGPGVVALSTWCGTAMSSERCSPAAPLPSSHIRRGNPAGIEQLETELEGPTLLRFDRDTTTGTGMDTDACWHSSPLAEADVLVGPRCSPRGSTCAGLPRRRCWRRWPVALAPICGPENNAAGVLRNWPAAPGRGETPGEVKSSRPIPPINPVIAILIEAATTTYLTGELQQAAGGLSCALQPRLPLRLFRYHGHHHGHQPRQPGRADPG